MKTRISVFGIVLTVLFQLSAHPQTRSTEAQPSGKIPAESKVFIAPMPDGFDTYLRAAMTVKHVPLNLVENKEAADFVIAGASESQKASTAKKVIMWNWHSNEDASIRVSDSKTGVVVYAYTAVKNSSAHGRQSTAEACAKHLKEKVESGK
jgi:hypothetical protein